MTAVSCIRPADCLGAGRAFLEAHRVVRAAPAPAPRRPMPQQGVQVPSTSVPGLSRPVRGRPNRRQRRRRSPPAAGSPTRKLVMENVVILKRGEQIPPKVAVALGVVPPAASKSGAQAETASPVVAANQRGAQTEEVVAAADKHSTAAEKAGVEHAKPVTAAADQHGQDTLAKKAEAAPEQRGAKGEEDRHLPVTAARMRGEQGTRAEAAPRVVYSGATFVEAPEPRELPMPVLLLNGRGARLRLANA